MPSVKAPAAMPQERASTKSRTSRSGLHLQGDGGEDAAGEGVAASGSIAARGRGRPGRSPAARAAAGRESPSPAQTRTLSGPRVTAKAPTPHRSKKSRAAPRSLTPERRRASSLSMRRRSHGAVGLERPRSSAARAPPEEAGRRRARGRRVAALGAEVEDGVHDREGAAGPSLGEDAGQALVEAAGTRAGTA